MTSTPFFFILCTQPRRKENSQDSLRVENYGETPAKVIQVKRKVIF
jgi:hypothetical protein